MIHFVFWNHALSVNPTMMEGKAVLEDPDTEYHVTDDDIVLYLKAFPETLVPPRELNPIIWGVTINARTVCPPWPTILPDDTAASWQALPVDRRCDLAGRVMATGVDPGAVSAFLGGQDRALLALMSAPGGGRGRRGRRIRGRQVFRFPTGSAQANAFIDAFRLQFCLEPPTAQEFLEGFVAAWAAYDAVVDVALARLDANAAFAVAVSAFAGEIVQLPCPASRSWYYAHRDFARAVAPWLTLGTRSLSMADRVRFFLLYYVPAAERPVFSADEIAVARLAMQPGSARKRPCGQFVIK